MPYGKRKRPLRGSGVAVGALCPIAPNVLWQLDFQFDQTADRRTCTRRRSTRKAGINKEQLQLA